MSGRDDDLFSPSLTQASRRHLEEGERPWRLGSQLYVGFFGGPLAAAGIGYLNAQRLGLPQRSRLLIAAAGLACLLAIVIAAAVVGEGDTPRLFVVVGGVAAYLVSRQLQRDADRLHAVNQGGDEYDSLWGPGLAAVLVGGLATVALLLVVA